MKLALIILILSCITVRAQNEPSTPRRAAAAQPVFDQHAAVRFAQLALACVHKEYPNKISHSMNSDADVAPPRKLTPAFYGCYDWHSSVHGHWLLARLARAFPDAPFTSDVRAALEESLTAENIAQEVAYLNAEGRASFERPYGLAGSCNSGWNCASGRRPNRMGLRRGSPPTCVRSKMQQLPGSRPGCPSSLIPCALASTIRPPSLSD